jgi:hypothetical protein
MDEEWGESCHFKDAEKILKASKIVSKGHTW